MEPPALRPRGTDAEITTDVHPVVATDPVGEPARPRGRRSRSPDDDMPTAGDLRVPYAGAAPGRGGPAEPVRGDRVGGTERWTGRDLGMPDSTSWFERPPRPEFPERPPRPPRPPRHPA